jgi:hypothetical protein
MLCAYVHLPDGRIVQVEVLDTFQQMSGVTLACVRALVGKPFVGGHTYPVRTEFATVKASQISLDGGERVLLETPPMIGAGLDSDSLAG